MVLHVLNQNQHNLHLPHTLNPLWDFSQRHQHCHQPFQIMTYHQLHYLDFQTNLSILENRQDHTWLHELLRLLLPLPLRFPVPLPYRIQLFHLVVLLVLDLQYHLSHLVVQQQLDLILLQLIGLLLQLLGFHHRHRHSLVKPGDSRFRQLDLRPNPVGLSLFGEETARVLTYLWVELLQCAGDLPIDQLTLDNVRSCTI